MPSIAGVGSPIPDLATLGSSPCLLSSTSIGSAASAFDVVVQCSSAFSMSSDFCSGTPEAANNGGFCCDELVTGGDDWLADISLLTKETTYT